MTKAIAPATKSGAAVPVTKGAVVMAGYGLLVATMVYFGVLAWLAVAAGRGVASMFGGG